MASRDAMHSLKVMMRYGVPQKAAYELEAIELTTTEVGVCEGLEGGFISFEQHALMSSTIYDTIAEIELLEVG
jgi:hypothetical protein